jgi:hypothetical protein
MSRVQCISVIDEVSPSNATITSDWNNFKAQYPNREMWVLDPGGAGDVFVPSSFSSDPLAHGPITVARDNNVVANRSDWFAICNLQTLPAGSIISVAIDTSGSMTLNTVRASYNYFIQRCAAAGITIVFDLTFGDERWIPPHIKDVAPSANFTGSPLTINYGDTATLSWIVFGDAVSASIDNGIGAVAFTGSTVVTPTVATTYTLTAIGVTGVGNTSRNVDINVLAPPRPTISLSANPISIIRGQTTSTLSWSVSGSFISSVTLTNYGSVTTSGNQTVSPTTTTTYTLTAVNPGGTSTAQVTVTVYVQPTFTISLNKNPIIAGESTTLNWSTTGDASNITWTSGGITNLNLNSNATVNPITGTTYSATVSGLGGSASGTITLRVYQIPTVSITGPASINYGSQATLTYSSSYSDITLKVTPTYTYDTVVTGTVVNLTKPTSAEIGVGITSVSGNFDTIIPWTSRGPRSITYLIEASGSGGSVSRQLTIPVNIDETPVNVIVPETEDVYKNEDPVITPDVIVTSNIIQVDDIDIPVEIKSDHPIEVSINGNQIWNKLRQI